MNALTRKMEVSDENQYKVAILQSYETECDAEILRITAVYKLKQEQVKDIHDRERKEAVHQVNVKEDLALDTIRQECFQEEEDAKARHSVKLAAIKEKYQISDHLSASVSQPVEPRSSTLAASPSVPVGSRGYDFGYRIQY